MEEARPTTPGREVLTGRGCGVRPEVEEEVAELLEGSVDMVSVERKPTVRNQADTVD